MDGLLRIATLDISKFERLKFWLSARSLSMRLSVAKKRVKKGGEMKTGVKAPLAILSALAFLAGCKSSSSKTGLETGPKTGFLHLDGDSVWLIE